MTETEAACFLTAITCPACSSIFNDPRNFPSCPHSLCFECLKKLPLIPVKGKTTDQVAVVECPVCNVRSTAIAAPNFTNFWVNSTARDVAEMMSSHSTAASINDGNNAAGILCNHLIVAEPKVECLHCNKTFCDSCRLVHTEVLKQEILSIHETWTKLIDEGKLSNESVLQFENKLQADVKAVEEHVELFVSSSVDGIRSSLDERGKKLVSEAQSLRNERLDKIRQAIGASCNEKFSGDLSDQLDKITKESVLKLTFHDISNLHQTVSRLDKELSNLDNVDASQVIKFSIVQSLEAKSIEKFSPLLKCGSILLNGTPIPDEDGTRKSAPDEATNGRSSLPTNAVETAVGNGSSSSSVEFDVPSPTEVVPNHSFKLKKLSINEPTAVLYLRATSASQESQFLVPFGTNNMALFERPLHMSNRFKKLSLQDPDRQQDVAETTGRMVCYGERIFMADFRGSRLIVFDLDRSGRIYCHNGRVLARDKPQGLAINVSRKEVYTCFGNTLQVYGVDQPSERPKATGHVLPEVFVLGASNEFGVVYRIASQNQNNGLRKLHCKNWPVGSQLPEVGASEANGFDLGAPIMGPCRSVHFDQNNGNLFLVDSQMNAIRMYSKPGQNGVVTWTHRFVITDQLFIPVDIAVLSTWSFPGDTPDSPNTFVTNVAVLDVGSQLLISLRLPY